MTIVTLWRLRWVRRLPALEHLARTPGVTAEFQMLSTVENAGGPQTFANSFSPVAFQPT